MPAAIASFAHRVVPGTYMLRPKVDVKVDLYVVALSPSAMVQVAITVGPDGSIQLATGDATADIQRRTEMLGLRLPMFHVMVPTIVFANVDFEAIPVFLAEPGTGRMIANTAVFSPVDIVLDPTLPRDMTSDLVAELHRLVNVFSVLADKIAPDLARAATGPVGAARQIIDRTAPPALKRGAQVDTGTTGTAPSAAPAAPKPRPATPTAPPTSAPSAK